MENNELIRIKSLVIDGKPSVEVYLHGNPTHLESILFTALMSTPKLKDLMINAVSLYLFEQASDKQKDVERWLMEEDKARLN